MNKDWSEKNKEMQVLLGKKDSFKEGLVKILELREEMFSEITRLVETYPEEDFAKQPFLKAKGFHCTTMAWSIWHVFRIEDVVSHEMIAKDQQIFIQDNYQEKTGSPVITVGNELDGEAIGEFSKSLQVKPLYEYAQKVKASSDKIIENLSLQDLKTRFTEEDKKRLEKTGCVDLVHPDSFWLIDYWCGKDVAGLLKMPFSRHWIMHIEAMNRITTKL